MYYYKKENGKYLLAVKKPLFELDGWKKITKEEYKKLIHGKK